MYDLSFKIQINYGSRYFLRLLDNIYADKYVYNLFLSYLHILISSQAIEHCCEAPSAKKNQNANSFYICL